jgi:hypothetical protein
LLKFGSQDAVKNSAAIVQQQQQQQQLHGAAIFSLFWSLGSFTSSVSRQKFTSHFWKLFREGGSEVINNFDSLLSDCHVYDWSFDVSSCVWKLWLCDVPTCSISPGSDPASIIVPTIDGVRHACMLRVLLSARAHVLFVGGTGTGKTVVVTQTLLCGLSENWLNHMMSLSALSTANVVRDIVSPLLCVN